MSYDGTVGFPKCTHLEKGETPEVAINREMCKRLGCGVDKLVVTPADHLLSRVSHVHGKKFCLHHYAIEISLGTVQQLEKSTLTGSNYGQEVTIVIGNILFHLSLYIKVLGVIRCPLYTLPNGLGFPAFLKYQFDGDSKDCLFHVIRERKLLSQTELTLAMDSCIHVNTLVTVQDADV